jgi:predicted metal-binding protein
MNHDENLRILIEEARKAGATDLASISARSIVVEDDLADRCRQPRCENYGLSKSCPPHVAGPSGLRERLKGFSRALFFRIDVPSESLFSSERRGLFQLLHEIAAGIENSAVEMGFPDAQAYAGGSCKKIFCDDRAECLALKGGECRHPRFARPSMSGFGIHVARLYEQAGWKWRLASTDETASICGLVLID